MSKKPKWVRPPGPTSDEIAAGTHLPLNKEDAARGLKMLLTDPRISPVARERAMRTVVADTVPAGEVTAYIERLVGANPALPWGKIRAIADDWILGNMAEGTFRNKVAAAKKKLKLR